jgi:hypothetical protein
MIQAREVRVRKRASLLAGLAAAACIAASAAPAEAHSLRPTDWRSYVEAPKSSQVPAAEATVLSGNVQNPQGLTSGERGLTTFTVVPGGPPATVLLDYGKEVLGTPFITVKSYAPAAASLALQLNFSERRQDLYTPGNSTLAAPAAAGSRTITVADPSTFALGDTLVIGGQTNTITAIDGSILSLVHRLASDEPEGTAVTSTPGALTGDGVGLGGYSRPQSIDVTTHSQSSGTFEGGLRLETVTLSTPGTVTLSGAGMNFEAYLGTPDKYQGHFLSSSAALNTMWYDGAYTEQTDMVAPGEAGAIQPAVLDGAKRDRKIWSGDIAIEGPGILDSLGANGADYVKQSLLKLLSTSTIGSGLAAFGTPTADALPFPPVYSNTYSSWTVDDATTYYRATGDTGFAKQVLPYLEGQLSYDSTLTDSAGLIATTSDFGGPSSGLDWDLYDGPKAGTVASVNMLYYRILTDVAYIESQLGDSAKAVAYLGTAAKVKNAINANLYDPGTGAYDTSESARGTIAQDANSFALLFGIAPQGDVAGIVKALKSLWGARGSEPFSANADESQLISPYITAFEVEGLYQVGDSADAEKLLALTWNQMIDPDNPSYTGTFWENYLPDGTLQQSSISSAHGWSSGPTPTLSGYVLGVQPVDPGYATFTVNPHLGTLKWASGAVPTPHGQIIVGWTRRGAICSLTVQVPPGTIGRITTPAGISVSIQGGAHGVTRTLTLNP